MPDLTFRQRLTNHLHQLGLDGPHIAYDLREFEREIREQVAQQLYDQNPDRDADFTAGGDWAIDTIRNA